MHSVLQSLGHDRTNAFFELICTDLSGIAPVPTLANSQYYISFIDDYTRYMWVCFLKVQSDAGTAIRDFIAIVEAQFTTTVRQLLMNNGKQYVNAQLHNYLNMKGIIHSTVPSYAHEFNGVAKQFNWTTRVMVHTMLLDTRNTLQAIHDSPTLDVRKLWGEATSTPVYLKNRLLHATPPNNIMPYESLFKSKPTISHLQPFGKFCWTHISKERKSCKLVSRAEKSIFVGYTNNSTTSILNLLRLNSMQVWEIRASDCKTVHNSRTSHSTTPDLPPQSAFPAISDDLDERIMHLSLTAAEVDPTDPRTYKQAITRAESCLWQAAMDKEIAFMHNQNVWSVVPTPRNRNIVGSK